MREVDIRRELHARIRHEHRAAPDTVVVEELGLCKGVARVDLAAVNGSLHGYEIKSERDTFERLPGQTRVYSQALDFVTLVIASNHGAAAPDAIPRWWGIIHAEEKDGRINLRRVRRARRNPAVDPVAVAQLLWRGEVLEELERIDAVTGFRSKPRALLWQRLTSTLSPKQLGDVVRRRLKTRRGWRDFGPSR